MGSKKGSGFSFSTGESFVITTLCIICGTRFSQESTQKRDDISELCSTQCQQIYEIMCQQSWE